MDSVLDSKALSNPFQKEDQRHGHTLEHNHFLLLLPLTEKASTKGDIVHKTHAMEYEYIEISVILD